MNEETKYTKCIELYKVETLPNAEYPQEEKYPSGTVIKSGYMFEHSKPKINECFYVYDSKIYANFRTSTIQEIIEENEEFIIFKTINSTYKVNIDKGI